MTSNDIIQLEQQYVLGVYSRPSFVIERGEGSTLYDTEGNAYLDCVAGIAVNALGYNDAGVNQALSEAAATGVFHVSNLYHTAPHARLAQLLCEESFADKVHYCNSGAEANEGAFKFARRYAREQGHADKNDILAFTGAFHGRTMGSLAATPRPKYQDPFAPLMPGVRFAEFNNLTDARAQMDDGVCAIIVEPVQGEGGIYPATPEFLRGLRELADEHDALLIYDEVQCGVGRTGKLWGYETIGGDVGATMTPDILTAAKPLAGGLPMGAILMTQRVADAMHKGDHGSTFAGGPLVAHVAHHVVGRIADPAFLATVRAKGVRLKEMLEEINSPHILAVRGEGLLVGVELDIEAAPIINRAYGEGLILVNAGANVLRFVPPLVITDDELAHAVQIVAKILSSS
ncbi:MAG: acetylornithine/succinylornithine family transaminase [Caldilineaceae bacterium]|nr:acetylornithine/succinylornithine family transaminase [Caldilineaceae bacterium]